MYVLQLAGEEDAFARQEAATAAQNVRTVGAGVAVADEVDPGEIERLAYTRRASALVGRGEPTVAGAKRVPERLSTTRQPTGRLRCERRQDGTWTGQHRRRSRH